jgi:hypothetical protein
MAVLIFPLLVIFWTVFAGPPAGAGTEKIRDTFLTPNDLGELTIAPKEKSRLEQGVKSALRLRRADLRKDRLALADWGTYNFLFGRLTRAEFDFVKSYFAIPLTRLVPEPSYDANRSYELLDFLLPKIQAAIGKNLSGNLNHDIELAANCWSTVHDVLVSSRDPLTTYLYLSDGVEAATLLRDRKYSSEVPIRELRPFDYVLFLIKDENGKVAAEHAAIYIGADLVFQKSGAQEIDFYQIESLSAVTKNWRSVADQIFVEYRRPTASLPLPSEIWPQALEQIVPVKIVKNQQGRHEFAADDPVSLAFRYLRISGLWGPGRGYEGGDLSRSICEATERGRVLLLRADANAFLVREIKLKAEDPSLCLDQEGRAVPEFRVEKNSLMGDF